MFRELLCCIHNNCTGGTNRYACNVQSKWSQNACGSCLRSRRQPNFVIHIKLLFELWRTAVWYRGPTGTWSSVGGTLKRAHINYASFQGRYPEDHTNTFSKLPSVLIKCFNKTTQPWYQSITLITNSPSRSCFHSSDGSKRPALLLDERRWKFFRPLQSSLGTIHIMHNVQHYNIQWRIPENIQETKLCFNSVTGSRTYKYPH